MDEQVAKCKAENEKANHLLQERDIALHTLKQEMESFEMRKRQEQDALDRYKDEILKKVTEKVHAASKDQIRKMREELEKTHQQLLRNEEEMKLERLKWQQSNDKLKMRVDELNKKNKELELALLKGKPNAPVATSTMILEHEDDTRKVIATEKKVPVVNGTRAQPIPASDPEEQGTAHDKPIQEHHYPDGKLEALCILHILVQSLTCTRY